MSTHTSCYWDGLLPIAPGVPLSSGSGATPGRRREDGFSCMAVEWPAEHKGSGALDMIGRMRGATATAGHMSGQSGLGGWSLVNSSCRRNLYSATNTLMSNEK